MSLKQPLAGTGYAPGTVISHSESKLQNTQQPHLVQYDLLQSPNYPIQIKASAASATTPLRTLTGVGL